MWNTKDVWVHSTSVVFENKKKKKHLQYDSESASACCFVLFCFVFFCVFFFIFTNEIYAYVDQNKKYTHHNLYNTIAGRNKHSDFVAKWKCTDFVENWHLWSFFCNKKYIFVWLQHSWIQHFWGPQINCLMIL